MTPGVSATDESNRAAASRDQPSIDESGAYHPPGCRDAIGFCRAEYWQYAKAHPEPGLARSIAFALFATFTLLIADALHTATGSTPAAVVALCGLGAAVAIPALVIWYRRRRELAAVPMDQPRLDLRLNCVAAPPWILQHGDLCDVPFEPKLFRFYNPYVLSTRMKKAREITAIGVFAVLWFGAWALGITRDAPSLFLWLTATAAGYITAVLLWPTWFRVVPGRLDVLRFSLLDWEPVYLKSHPLRDTWVQIDLRRFVLSLGQPAPPWERDEKTGDRTPAIEYPLYLMRRRTEFAHAILMAAISTHEAPPLPDDALLG